MSLDKITCLDITTFRDHSNHVVLMSLLLHQKDIPETTSESFAYVNTGESIDVSKLCKTHQK